MTAKKRIPNTIKWLVEDSRKAAACAIEDLRPILLKPTNEVERAVAIGRVLDALHEIDKRLGEALNGRE